MRVLLAAAGGIAVIAGLIPASTAAVASTRPVVDWVSCAPQEVQEGVECGSITVPIDWSRRDGDTMSVRVYRFKAADRATVKGTIANFPSGPGETGDVAFASLRPAAPDYDLISLDPRGVGSSAPLTCDLAGVVIPPTVAPTSETGLGELRANQKKFRDACTVTPAPAMWHLDAASVARDMEHLRQALRLPRINIYGHSYGTLLGEKYLARFGWFVRASILEGVMDPAKDRRQFVTTTAAATQKAFEEFTLWCASDTACALRGQDPAAVLRRARATADSGAIPGTFYGRSWNSAAVISLFEARAMGGELSLFATELTRLAKGENPIPDSPGDDEPAATFNYPDPIVCQDFPLAVRGIDDAIGDLAAARQVAPTVGYNTNAHQYTSACVGWPGPVPGSGGTVTSRSFQPTLLVSNTGDLATPPNWAHSVRQQLGHKAALLAVDDTSHNGGIGRPGCAQKIILDYLHTLKTPSPATRCPAPLEAN